MRRVLALFLILAAGCNKTAMPGRATNEVIHMPVTSNSTDREITFKGAGGMELVGTLQVPAGDQTAKYPCVLLISGSGPTDRDGNQPILKLDTMKQFAAGLASAGIASFRFDKRACAHYQSSWPKGLDEIAAFFSWDVHLADALGAWEAMKGSGQVDPNKCAIMGHSEGGMIALSIAAKAKPQALVLASTPGRTFDAVIHFQLADQVQRGLAPKKLLDESDRIAAAMKASGKVPDDVPAELKPLYNASVATYYQQVCKVVPTDVLKGLAVPVLVMNGECDVQVDPKLDAEALFAACQDKAHSKLALIPLASHNYKPAKTRTEPGFTGDVVQEALDAVHEFLVPVIGGKVPESQETRN